MTTSQVLLRPGQRSHSFRCVRVTPLTSLRAVVYELEHDPCGARLLHVHTDDTENLFSVSFPTPPPDDTGLPHILEHSVLAGSRKFPVREPFFEMIKMSMATFINAMTGWDCTYYPVASNVKQDLFNLADVYMDAVFHPLLTEETFRREGHHLAPADREQPLGDLTVNGIVFNEMKGVFSSPESRLHRCVGRALFPDSIYGRESGGEPESIPDLTYDSFAAYYRDRYHPARARFVLYGNIPTPESLAFIEPRLAGYDALPDVAGIERQPRWAEPRRLTDSYPVGAGEDLSEKTYLSLHWLTGDAADPSHVLTMRLLNLVLFGHEAAPLRKALIDSKLGVDLVYAGDHAAGCEATFHVGLKGSEPDRLDAFEALVLDTLGGLARDGIPAEAVDAAFRQASFHYLEVLPLFPLHVMERVLEAWLYGRDPLAFLRLDEHLEQCRRQRRRDPGFLAAAIQQHLLDNPHRLAAVLRPDAGMQGVADAAFASRMRRVRDGLDDDTMREIGTQVEELDRHNSEPNGPEALASLPQLRVADLPERLTQIPFTRSTAGRVPCLRADVFANGVNYLVLDFDLNGMPDHLWLALPRYADGLAKLGAAGLSYEQTARRQAAATGGISSHPVLETRVDDATVSLHRLRICMKALDEQVPEALALLNDLVFALDASDLERLSDVAQQARTHYRTDLVQNGAATARHHAARGLSIEGHLDEVLHGLPQLAATEKITAAFDRHGPDLAASIGQVRDFLVSAPRLTASFTGSDRAADAVAGALADWSVRFGAAAVDRPPPAFSPPTMPAREGLAGSLQVAFCARVMPAPHAGDPRSVPLAVAVHLMGLDYILTEIRLKGNAYGAWFHYAPTLRQCALGSYRDPHVVRTLRIFDGIRDIAQTVDWSQTDVDRAIVALAKQFEKPIRPAQATEDVLHRALSGVTPKLRQARYDELRRVTPATARQALADTLADGWDAGAVCVVAGRDKLEAANRELGDAALAIENILPDTSRATG